MGESFQRAMIFRYFFSAFFAVDVSKEAWALITDGDSNIIKTTSLILDLWELFH